MVLQKMVEQMHKVARACSRKARRGLAPLKRALQKPRSNCSKNIGRNRSQSWDAEGMTEAMEIE